ncbi:hypothetical protein V2G26_007258 [Clonostachys chloroleuca]
MASNNRKGLSVAPAAACICLLATITLAITTPLLVPYLELHKQGFVFLLYELPGLIINLTKPYIATIAINYASLVYLHHAKTVTNAESVDERVVAEEKKIILCMQRFLSAHPTRVEPFRRQIEETMTEAAANFEHGQPNTRGLGEALFSKVRKCKPEALIEASDKAIRNTVILFQFFYRLFSWVGCLITVGVIFAAFICQMVLERPMVNQDKAMRDTIKQLERAGHGATGSEAMVGFRRSLHALSEASTVLSRLRACRDSLYLFCFFLLFQCLGDDQHTALFAAYKYLSSIREAFEKLGSCRVQLRLIIANGSWTIARVALQAWWDLSSEDNGEEKQAHVHLAVHIASSQTQARYSTFETGVRGYVDEFYMEGMGILDMGIMDRRDIECGYPLTFI